MVRKSLIQKVSYIDENGIIDDATKILKVNKNLCLIGETGTGKTLLGHKLGEVMGNIPIFEITLSIDTNRWELVASDVLINGATVVRDGIVLMWLKAKKGILLINGFNYAPANVISLFESLADWTSKIYIPELQQEFQRSAEHYLIITMNPYEKIGYCLKGDSLISTPKGFTPIEMLKTDTTVLNQQNNRQLVTDTTTRQYNDDLYTIKGIGILPIDCSKDHKFLVVSRKKIGVYDKEKYQRSKNTKKSFVKHQIETSEPFWKDAEQLVKFEDRYGKPYDCIIFPKLKTEIDTDISENKAFLLGLFTADGSTTKNDTHVCWCLSDVGRKKELVIETTNRLIQEGYNPYTITQGRGRRVCISSRKLYEWLRENIGTYAINKQIPETIMNSNKAITTAFLKGYLAGDGSFGKRGISFKTVSKKLALQLQKLFSKLDIFVCLDMPRLIETTIIQGKVINQHQKYQGRIGRYFSRDFGVNGEQTKGALFTRIGEDKDCFYLPIKEISKQSFTGTLYDITTEDATLQVNNIIVHNCGTHQMNIATMRRFEPIYVHYLSPMKETELVQQYFNDYNWVRKLVEFAHKTRVLYREGKLTMPLTTGNLINYAGLKSLDMSDGRIVSVACAHFLDEERPTVKRLWEDVEEVKGAKQDAR